MNKTRAILRFPLFLFAVTVISIAGCTKSKRSHWDVPNHELKSLNEIIAHADVYAKKAEKSVDSLKLQLNESPLTPQRRFEILKKISDHYRARVADSALFYSTKALEIAREIGDEHYIFQGTLLMTKSLSAAGFFTAAIDQFRTINLDHTSIKEKIQYWGTGRRLYSNLSNYVGEGTLYYSDYFDQYVAYDDSLIKYLPDNELQRKFLICERLIDNGKGKEARASLEKIMASTVKFDNLYGMTAYQMALTYRNEDQTRYAALLAEAAESDILAGIRDGYALPALAAWLYNEEHFTEAFRYINFALNDAFTGNARMRLVNISRWMPQIDEAYRINSNESKNEFAAFSILVSILFIALIILLLFLLRALKKRRQVNSALASSSKLKDRYIRDFINLCSVYSEKYDSLTKTVTRKISAGQSQELLKIVKYGKASENDNEEFYKTIDSVFLGLYPDFIEKINALLLPDQQFEVTNIHEGLNPELRIYGFVRLGVTESAKIARILNYSVNTVYAYRNRMRNRALNRDTFEEEVMNLNSGNMDD